MSTKEAYKQKMEAEKLEQLMAEADELVCQINSEALKDMEEEHRIQFEKHAQKLESIKSEIQGDINSKDVSKLNFGADGMHEAILDIVKAMQNFQNKLY
ncbi:conserved hypothetical protein [Desulfamplus magnetovallimortis]|uniref:Uncharacterized protein n=1 Tax=Desulfamplus magnetovallimortis TaxID=1246637 RepID=A0A1W1HIU8_9BACT|nr:hypothetical protein [Desulfamplus magnetovallimortis]SLM32363.1 conserved hypothetical protein [Desulfamplus magnetovallimortis]